MITIILICAWHILIWVSLNQQSSVHDSQSDEEDIQLPSDSDYITLPTDRRKCGAERVAFSGEGSSSVPSPVKEKKFEKQGLAQEQSSLC